jgi:hypothetical protein
LKLTKVLTKESIDELDKAIEFQYSAMVYVAENPDKLENEVDDFLKVSAIRFDGHNQVFVASKEVLALYFHEHVGRLDNELEEDVLYIIRGSEPMLLELAGDLSHFEGIWGSFEEYRYLKLEKLYTIPENGMYYFIVLDGGCSDKEMQNINIWYTFREGEFLADGFLISKEEEEERYLNLKSKWNLTRDCECMFVKRINKITLDKFKPDYKFVGIFTLDDYSRKLTKDFSDRYVVSQSFEDIKGEEDYRLVAENLDSTYQELNSDSAILFFNRNQSEFDEFFKNLRDEAMECKGDDCGDHQGLKEKIRDQGLQMFSLNTSYNDLPSFVIEHTPTILIFKQGKEEPTEIKLEKTDEIVKKLMSYMVREEARIDSEL